MVRQLGLEGESDDVHLLRSGREGWTFITHDTRDFALLHGAWCRWAPAWGLAPAPAHAGIILLPQIGPTALIGPVGRLLAATPPLANHLYAWETTTGWRTFDNALGWQPFGHA
jgi:hypothetical protein